MGKKVTLWTADELLHMLKVRQPVITSPVFSFTTDGKAA